MENICVYDHPESVYEYANNVYLDKPELTFYYKFSDKMKSWKMLDIGVGGGRTTHYFAPLVCDYTGIDFSRSMIDHCRQKFNVKLEVCDARDMSIFKDSSFDFVFFSYNGLDCISHEDRLKALKEIRRVLKNRGVFFFSSHNLQSIDRYFMLKMSMRPDEIYRNLINAIIRLKNQPYKHIKALGHCTLFDGAHGFKIWSYYITPEEQIRQLKRLGFRDIKVYSLKDGYELKRDLDQAKDPWLHYLCEK